MTKTQNNALKSDLKHSMTKTQNNAIMVVKRKVAQNLENTVILE